MKLNRKLLVTIATTLACIGCARAQAPSAAVAPAGVPSPASRSQDPWPEGPSQAGGRGYAQASTGNYGGGMSVVSVSRSSSDSVPPVVIQFSQKDAVAIASMEEDLAIMTHIIDRAVERVGENGPDEKLGIRMIYTSGGKSVRALYLEGSGPLFMVKVNFPVHAAGGVGESPAEEKQGDSEWDDARRSVFGLNEDVRWAGSSSGVPYEAARVDSLKKHLTAALKNAANMKGVKPDEHINISVFGSPNVIATGMRQTTSTRSSRPTAAKSEPSDSRSNRPMLDVARSTLQGTVFTLRAKKSDIDAAAKGSLDDAAFAKKITANSYSGSGYGLTSVNSWIRRSSSSNALR